MPDGSTSPSPTTRSMSENWPTCAGERAQPAPPTRSGSAHALGRRTRETLGRSSMPRSMSRKGVGHLLVDHPHHLLGGHAVGGERGHEGAGAGAHVDVELVDRAVDRQQVEARAGRRSRRRAPVNPPPPSTSAVLERRRPPPLRGSRSASRLCPRPRVELDDLAHPPGIVRRPVHATISPLPAARSPLLAVALVRRSRALLAPCAPRGARPDAAGRPRPSLERAMRQAPARGRARCVRDLDTGGTLFAIRPDTLRVPASVEKLYTTSTALLRFGPARPHPHRGARRRGARAPTAPATATSTCGAAATRPSAAPSSSAPPTARAPA